MIRKILLLLVSLSIIFTKAFSGDLRVEIKKKVEDCKRRTQHGDRITWWYRGVLVSGVQFDTGTYTAVLGAGQVIEGVDRGMMKMCVGEKRKMTIPPHLAYGNEGTKGIPPYSTLIFDVELQKIYRPGEDPEPELEKEKEVEIKITRVDKNCKVKSRAGDTIKWNYVGTLKSGKEFDRGEYTATLGAGQVIEGVDIGMKGMCVGDRRKMVIPSHLGYGDQGYGELIPGGSTLIFEVELLNIDRPKKEL